jgi:hypothetical protein
MTRYVQMAVCLFATAMVFVACSGDNGGGAVPGAMTVVSTVPSDGAADVSRFDLVTATFNKPIDAKKITSFAVYSDSTGTVTGTITLDAGHLTAIFTPAQPLSSGVLYRATLKATVPDGNGRPAEMRKEWSFTTNTHSLYWTEYCSGTIKGMGLNGGRVVTLASGLNYVDAIAVDATNLYWLEQHSIKKMSVNGGPVTTLASGQGCPIAIAVDSTNVYWTDGCNWTVDKVALSGGPTTTLASGSINPFGIAVDSTNIFWTEGDGADGWYVMQELISGGTATIVTSTPDNPRTVAVDTVNVYWTDNNSPGYVMECPVSGGTATTLISGVLPGGIVVDSTNVYWTDVVISSGQGTVNKISKDGGPSTILASSPHPESIVVDDTNLYWTDGDGTVNRVSLNGGPVTILASGVHCPKRIVIGP